jgi:hypothetical protein
MHDPEQWELLFPQNTRRRLREIISQRPAAIGQALKVA